MKLGTKTYYTNKLDSIFSQRVRKAGKCDNCGKTGKMDTAHIISRKNRTLRWDMKNMLCLCPTCHFKFHQDPLEFTKFIQTKYPERYNYLMDKKDIITKNTARDLKELLENEK